MNKPFCDRCKCEIKEGHKHAVYSIKVNNGYDEKTEYCHFCFHCYELYLKFMEEQKIPYNKPIDSFPLSVRTYNICRLSNIKTIGDIVKLYPYELLKFKNFGRKSLLEIEEILKSEGLSLK
jgi:DNA-directed RNA polymerase alpha subunit